MCKRRVRGASVIAGFWNPDYEQSESWTEAIVRELPILRQGDQGPHVRTMHHLMLARDVQGLEGVSDTMFTPAHSAGIRDLQTSADIEVDGVVGPQTWPVLLAVH
ncbi:peptidoglycan-binding domain-containing protein [Nonomuraea sp. H19]|uniref:peptidoglycan-binding domain-containing protein n=1 Tax=Nonomuraea sp. H19 TaxID=3452206 RepID=UPI003F88C38E